MTRKLRTISHITTWQAKRLCNRAIVAIRRETLAPDSTFQVALVLYTLCRRTVWPSPASSANVNESSAPAFDDDAVPADTHGIAYR